MAGSYDIEIVQGSDTNDIEIVPTEDNDTPISLSGFTAAMHIREKVNSPTTLDVLTTANSRITITTYTEDGQTFYKITLKFPSATTILYTWDKAVYDLEIYNGGGAVDRLLEGCVIVNPEVTRQ